MKKLLALTLSLGLALMATACGDGGKATAQAALKAAQGSFDTAKVEAAKYVPDQVKGVQDALRAANDAFAKGNYAQALSEAQGLASKVTALGEAAAAKKTELTSSWSTMSAGLPGIVQAIQGRVDILSKAKKLPAGMTKDAFEGARSGLDTATKTWTEASEAFQAGDLVNAVAKAQTVKTKAAEVMTALGMPVPDALK